MGLTPKQQEILKTQGMVFDNATMQVHVTYAPYGWIVDKDHGAADNAKHGLKSRVGWVGPKAIKPEIEKRLRAGEGRRWLTKSADDDLGYEGRIIAEPGSEDDFAPLDDLAQPDSGDVSIFYWENGKWEEL